MASTILLRGHLENGRIECGSAAMAAGTGMVSTTIKNVAYAAATYSSAPAAGHQLWTSAAINGGDNVIFRDAGTSGSISYVIIGDLAGSKYGGWYGKFGNLKMEIGTARMVAGSCDLKTNCNQIEFAHWTYFEAPGTCNQSFFTNARATRESGSYITVKDTNMNALSAGFRYLILGE